MRPSLAQELRDHDQHHLLTFWSDLSPAERDTLVEQIRGIDFAELSRLLAGQETAIDWALAAEGRAAAGISFVGRGRQATILGR